MKRLFPDYTYGPGPRQNCWWDETIAAPDWPILNGDLSVDVAIVGGGFTGLSAALYLAEAGTSVAVLEAATPGWGASGRNGGFCCLGGSKLSHSAMTRQFGLEAAESYEQAECDAVQLVADLLETHKIDADTHSNGETQLAHSARAMEKLRRNAEDTGILHEAGELQGLGFGGDFHGGYTNPVGFGLNPRKYLFGLASAAESQGARLFQKTAAESIRKTQFGFDIQTGTGVIRAANVLICTNGYSSEDVPQWMSGRYMPTQSTVLVTRPLSETELQAQGWTSNQICYDTRNLLHYFRLMPDRRFLFGMRGGLRSSPKAEVAIRRTVQQDFLRMFPKWKDVEVSHMWSGMVCLSRNLMPYAGPVPNQSGLFAAFAYHGNGVAMGTYCGRALARMVLSQPDELPQPIAQPPSRFPLGSWRRALMPPAYAAMAIADRWSL
ncbi:FAD-binding oxidoreductase [Ruegeria sp. Ofav3-42]|uniref:NAD(P)/FAD-dependent oxidoreductase n=1 Tax=Ruegeria sp. Ofav3-42 TaxID=2917759 RepID=UPI001EF3DD1C|nr:FAD-binding oxidoreductase [Ruegeria sp. Ofav3-42]MCG7520612.1 FAD-binding oxidoreductase [Ruegeria sp. Ofav3-42]